MGILNSSYLYRNFFVSTFFAIYLLFVAFWDGDVTTLEKNQYWEDYFTLHISWGSCSNLILVLVIHCFKLFQLSCSEKLWFFCCWNRSSNLIFCRRGKSFSSVKEVIIIFHTWKIHWKYIEPAIAKPTIETTSVLGKYFFEFLGNFVV